MGIPHPAGFNNDNYEWIYEFEGEAGDIILIELETLSASSSNLDSNLQLIRPDDRYINENFISRNNQTGILVEVMITGTHTLIVSRSNLRRGQGEGTFELSLNLVDPSPTRFRMDGHSRCKTLTK